MKNEISLKNIARKTFLALGMLMIMNTVLQAQLDKEEIEYIQNIFGMEKKAAIAQFLKIDSDNAFWPLYDLYENERKELGKKRLDLLEKYVNNFVDMPNVVTDDLIKQMQIQKKSLDSIIDDYYKKIKKSSGSKIAAQFYQFENYTLSAVRLEVLAGIPFIGELE